MKIIISPAKQMQIDDENIAECKTPVFINKSREILNVLQSKSYEELKQLWKCNDKLVKENFDRIMNMRLDSAVTPAVLAYDGLQYIHMGPRVFDYQQWQYVCDKLRIISGFYGLLRADDGVVPYRLEMQAKLKINECDNLYQYWGESIYKELVKDDSIILNLASKEYSKVIEPFIDKNVTFVTCVFATETENSYKVKATEAKMARGSMVKWCAENNINNIYEIRKFDVSGYRFAENISTASNLVFLK